MRSALEIDVGLFDGRLGNEVTTRCISGLSEPAILKSIFVNSGDTTLLDEFVEIGIHRPLLECGAAQFEISKNDRRGEGKSAGFEKIKDHSLSVLLPHIWNFMQPVLNHIETDRFAFVHADQLLVLLNCSMRCKSISGWDTVVATYDRYRAPTRVEGSPERAPARPPGGGHETAMTDSTYNVGAQNSGARPTNRRTTSSGSSGNDAPTAKRLASEAAGMDDTIDWERVKQEVGE